ncbi:Ig-like domain-containing protein [Ligilactobacillus salivarius]
MKYYIYQGLGDSEELTKIAEVTDVKTYTATGLKANTKYRFAVSAYNGLRESAKSNIITVTTAQIPVQSITLAISKTSFEVGETTKITVTLTPPNQTSGTPTLASTNTNVATVDNNGNLQAVGVGTTTITATLGGKTSNMLTIQVYEALVNVSNLTSSDVTANSVTLSWT